MVVISDDTLNSVVNTNAVLAEQLYLEKVSQYQKEQDSLQLTGESQKKLRQDINSYLDKSIDGQQSFKESDLEERYGDYK